MLFPTNQSEFISQIIKILQTSIRESYDLQSNNKYLITPYTLSLDKQVRDLHRWTLMLHATSRMLYIPAVMWADGEFQAVAFMKHPLSSRQRLHPQNSAYQTWMFPKLFSPRRSPISFPRAVCISHLNTALFGFYPTYYTFKWFE